MEIQLDEKGYEFLTIKEYKGKYRLEVGKTSAKDGNWYAKRIKTKQWNSAESKFEYTDKESNMSISIGDIDKLQSFIAALNLMINQVLDKAPTEDAPPF